MGYIEGSRQRLGASTIDVVAGASFGAVEVIRSRYDFAVDGGAIGNVNLMDALDIPAGFVIYGGFIDVITPLTSGGGATVALTVEGAGDVLAAAAVAGAPWSTVGRKAILPAFTGPSSIKTSVARNLVAAIAVAPLTAGVFDVYLVGIRTA